MFIIILHLQLILKKKKNKKKNKEKPCYAIFTSADTQTQNKVYPALTFTNQKPATTNSKIFAKKTIYH